MLFDHNGRRDAIPFTLPAVLVDSAVPAMETSSARRVLAGALATPRQFGEG